MELSYLPNTAGWMLAALAIVTLLLLWSRSLQRQVAARTAVLNQTALALQADTERFRDLYNTVPCGCHTLDAEGIFVEINDTELGWLGCSREAVIGKLGLADFLAGVQRENFLHKFAKFKASGAAPDMELELVPRSGPRLTVTVSSTSARDADGRTTLLRSTLYDITQQVRAERALRATLDHTPNVAVQWFDRDGRVRYWNNASTTLFGWRSTEAMGRTLGEIGLYSPSQARDFLDVVRGIDTHGRALEPAESTYFRKDGSQGVLLSTVFSIPSPEGDRYFACMDIDVTERYRSEEQLRATLENTPGVAVQWFDRQARVLYWNHAAEMLYGIDAEEAVGRRMDELIYTPEQYRGFVDFLDTLTQAHSATGVRQITLRTRHDLEVTVLRRACIIPNDGNEPIFACMEVDITDAQASEREREQLNTILTRVTEAMPVCLSYLDAEGRYVWTNTHNSARLGSQPDRMIGKMVRDVNMAANSNWKGGVMEAALDGRPQHDECEWQSPDGVLKRYERFVVPDKDASGVARGCTSVWVDITARKEAEHKIHRLNRVHSVLSNINAALVRIKNRQELFDEACRIAAEDGGFGVAWIGVVNAFTGRVDSMAWAGMDARAFQALETSRDFMQVGSALLARCIREKRPLLENDIAAYEQPADALQRTSVELGYRSVVFLPLVVNEEVTGLFGMMSKEPNFFTEDEVRLLTDLSGDVAFALEVIDKETRINYLAYYDPLTGLPNRTLFHERVGQLLHAARSREAKLALLMVDVRRFRFVNESLGRKSGDDLLRELAGRFLDSWAEPDNVGRISGDRFALVLSAYDNEALLVHAVEQSIIESLKQPFMVEGREVTLSSAAGIAVFPEDGVDADALFKNAEAALGQAKQSTEPYLFYQPKMNARMAGTLLIENKMRRALDRGQFELYYQPKFRTRGTQIAGFEALMRWNDPDAGLVTAGEFIPILEETGMIVEAGQWAMRRVLHEHAAWRQQGLNPPRIAVNVSAMQLRRKDFADQVRALVTEGALGAQGEPGLDLEITESLLMHDIEGCIEKLKAIRDLGVNIAIDDFGTGYSSLAYLSRLPVNALKIDRSFIDGMLRNNENMSIVSSIISLAHAMKLKVIAEGVETQQQLNTLAALECDEIQGYLMGRPVAAALAANLMRERAAETVGDVI